MNFRNCSVKIPEGKETTKDGATYVEVRNGNFSIKLKTFCTPKIAKITFQGLYQGDFVLEPGKSYDAIERSVKDYERFAVYDYDTLEASLMGKDRYTKDELGLIKVEFYEVKRKVQPLQWTYIMEPSYKEPWTISWGYGTNTKPNWDKTTISYTTHTAGSCDCQTSVIGTEGKSDQCFRTDDKYDIDYSKEPIVLYLRLIPRKPSVKYYQHPQPLKEYETPYPKSL